MPDIGIRAHLEWLGLIQPVGLVVAPAALVNAQILLDASDKDLALKFSGVLASPSDDSGDRTMPDFASFAREVLKWPMEQVAGAVGGGSIPDALSVSLPELGLRLEPTLAIADQSTDGGWQLLVRVDAPGTTLDRVSKDADAWTATPQEQFERLLRDTGVPIGLLVTDRVIRLVYAPRGESSGYLSFPVAPMATPSGRPMLQALVELLKWWRLSAASPTSQRLPHVLRESRKYQNEVSTKLAEQVLGGLYELTRGIQAADDAVDGLVLHDTLRRTPSEVYGGLLTTIMRLVFVLYSEERGILPQDAAWVEHYGVGALFERLRQDKSRYPDTMDQRYGAWPRLLSLFRILHDGASHGGMVIPARHGELFDPDRYPFLEGRPWGTRRVLGDKLDAVPRVSDGTILRLLERLLMLDEERLSYRTLDVEQIGSVYEAMMGFEVKAASGRSIAVRPKTRKPGSPSHPIVDLDELVATPGRDRVKSLKESADCELPTESARLLREASNIDGLLEALSSRVSAFTPSPIQRGGLVLVPTEERRRSGSHYTPRELTEPIVATALRPILEALGHHLTAQQLLGLKICDPAMGSGAFLVSACRYLGDRVVEAWQRSGNMPLIPPDEDPQLYARRLVAQQCLYGVDRNPYAVQLAKLSLWLVTLAKDHSFTFLDHALRGGDSLVGLTRHQIESFHWDSAAPATFWVTHVSQRLQTAAAMRESLERMAGSDDTREKVRLLREADAELKAVRLIGDAAIAAFFGGDKPRQREALRTEYESVVARWLADSRLEGLVQELADQLREREPTVIPFHWEMEFAEVFGRENPGFDCVVGNPPFLGGTRISTVQGMPYFAYLTNLYPPAQHLCDLVAYFFRRAFNLLRDGGSLGFVATNTVAQGDTRQGGLSHIIAEGGTIYSATRRVKWPGSAAVVVSVVHIFRGIFIGAHTLDRVSVTQINSFLLPSASLQDPVRLAGQGELFSLGSKIYGQGFVFDDSDEEANPLAERDRIISVEPQSASRIKPYIGGEELNQEPSQRPHRWVIYLSDVADERGLESFPELAELVKMRVKPARDLLGPNPNNVPLKRKWWAYQAHRPEFYRRIELLPRILAASQVSQWLSFAFLPTGLIYSHALVLIGLDQMSAFALLQSRIHEVWARLFGSSMKDDLRYTPSDCFETFPFPVDWRSKGFLATAGSEYYEFRAELMVANNEGLTATYNRFHDSTEHDAGIIRLRELHVAIDRAVLEAYGWADIDPYSEFIPEFDEEEIEPGSRAKRRYRLRWPDQTQDEVLARLLELNRSFAPDES